MIGLILYLEGFIYFQLRIDKCVCEWKFFNVREIVIYKEYRFIQGQEYFVFLGVRVGNL